MSDKLLTAIETVYDCVGDDYDRARALKAYSQLADDSPVMMADMNMLLGRATRVNVYNAPEEVVKIFTTRFKCPLRDMFIDVVRNHPPGVPILRQSLVSDEEWQKSVIYKIGSKPFNIHSEAASLISGKLLTKTLCMFSRYNDQESLDAETLSMISILNTHLTRAMGLQHRIDQLEEVLIKANNMLDLIDFGLILYGADKTPVFVNAAAQRILDTDDGLRLNANEMELADRDVNEQFQALIDAIYRSDKPIKKRSGGIISVPRLSRSRPYSLMVVPMQSKKLNMESVTAAVFLFDPHIRKTTAIDMFVSSYELTRSEAELAHALALGSSLEDAAEQRGVSRNTAKFHLHSIFEKTETSRQSELVSLLLRSVVGIGLKA